MGFIVVLLFVLMFLVWTYYHFFVKKDFKERRHEFLALFALVLIVIIAYVFRNATFN